MNNNQSKNDLSLQLYRPRRLYITSEDVSDFDNAGSCRFILKEPILPAEGFKLVYGLSSFGYAATAYNISKVQKNNVLCFKLSYRTPSYQVNSDNTITAIPSETKECYQKVVIPDGYYGTLEELLGALSNMTVTQVKSGLKVDVTKDSVTDSTRLQSIPNESINQANDIPFIILYQATNGGFQISVSLPEEPQMINDYYDLTTGFHYQAFQVNNIPEILYIVPGDEDSRGLYNLLFTNENDQPNKPLNIRTDLAQNGNNPPNSIVFYLECPLQYDSAITNPTDYIDPNFDFQYFALTGDQDHTELALKFVQDPFDGSHTSASTSAKTNVFVIYANTPFQSFYPPRLFPLYVEVDTNLETQNLTVDGYASNLLCRHFPLGADQGALSFFQSWDNPVMHHARSSRHTIDGIKIDFSSERDKWSFFNLTFFLEIVFYEMVEEEELPQFDNQLFQIPSEDAMTSQLQQYSGSFSDPFPIHSKRQNSGQLQVGSLRSSKLKKFR
jgi:hypothetical protein